MKPIDPTDTFVHVPHCDKDLPADEQSRFHCRPLTIGEMKRITNIVDPSLDAKTQKVKSSAGSGSITVDVARAVITGWDNFDIGDIETVKLTPSWGGPPIEMVREDQIQQIGFRVCAEIYQRARNDGHVTEEELGNS